MLLRISCCALLLLGTAAAAPAVLWASQPIRPNETALVQGVALGGVATVSVQIFNASDAQSINPTAVSDSGMHVLMPPTLRWPAVYELTPAGAASPFLLNAPEVRWIQGDGGKISSQGGWLRAFGSCLSLVATTPSEGALVEAQQALRRALDRRDAGEITD